MLKRSIFFTLIVCIFTGCCSPKQEHKGINKNSINQYIDTCVKIMIDSIGSDSVLTREKCACMLQALYSYDSTCFDAEVFILNTEYSIAIDSLCGITEFVEKYKSKINNSDKQVSE